MKYVNFLNHYEWRMQSFGWSVDECTALSGIIDKRANNDSMSLSLIRILGIKYGERE